MRLSRVFILLGLLLAFVSSALGETAELLPKSVGKFRQVATTSSAESLQQTRLWNTDSASALTGSQIAEYTGGNGTKAVVEIFRFRQDADAYELLSLLSFHVNLTNQRAELNTNLGTAGFFVDDQVAFFKGPNLVWIRKLGERPINLSELAQGLSDGLDKGEADIPALIKHLPQPEEAFKNAVYLNSFKDLSRLPYQPPVLSAVQSGGNADAAFSARSGVLIIEFNTPQLATENDQRIIARIQELWKLGQPAPTAYRRVGNYSVFVFDAPDEQTAKRLIDEVKYEQVVQWLGENPNIYKEAEKRYINTTLGVLVAVVKASGYALIGCLGLGALIGGLLFSYRRTRQKAVTFSDAGGMLRLNLDDLTVAQTDPARLLRERN
ncbi:MAG TPA: hypothetical protein VJ656_14385 [Pyrinomonadaceae bacterium]|nr:hypothetical protein [Pyrinomonadaceae bacterium]